MTSTADTVTNSQGRDGNDPFVVTNERGVGERALPPTPKDDSSTITHESSRNAVPQWQQVLATRHTGQARSRASSVFSCQTRMTVQSDDNRSIDIDAGGRTFHITRDGSLVHESTAPPPYPGPPLEEVPEESDSDDEATELSSEPDRPSTAIPGNRSLQSGIEPQSPNIVLTSVGSEIGDASFPMSSPTAKRLTMLELPQKLKVAFSYLTGGTSDESMNVSSPGTSAGSDTSNAAGSSNMDRVRKLRRTQSESSSLGKFRMYPQATTTTEGLEDLITEEDASGHESAMQLLPANHVEVVAASITQEYRRLMRELDREQRTRLHERDEELARLRTLLDEKDQVLRQQLRERDFVIETLTNDLQTREKTVVELKAQNVQLQQEMAGKIEKAGNEVENIWEQRWKEYEKLLIDNVVHGPS